MPLKHEDTSVQCIVHLPSVVCPLVAALQNNRNKLLLSEDVKKCIALFCLSGPDIGADQEDHIEDPSHLLPHGHSHRVGHGDRYGGKQRLINLSNISAVLTFLALDQS